MNGTLRLVTLINIRVDTKYKARRSLKVNLKLKSKIFANVLNIVVKFEKCTSFNHNVCFVVSGLT